MDVKLEPGEAIPDSLRKALTAWGQNRLSGKELVNASFVAMLELLDTYRHQKLPLPPEAVMRFRSMEPYEKAQMSKEAKQAFEEQFRGFLKTEQRVRDKNAGNFAHLKELQTWAQDKQLPESVMGQIREVLLSHQTQQPSEEHVLVL